MDISIITTCKSRLTHLKQVIESWKAFRPTEIIVVDVSCPDLTSEWLTAFHPSVRSVNVASSSFNLAHARNIGASAASCDYLFFVDADIILYPGLGEWFEKNLQERSFYSRAQNTPLEGIHEQGTFLCHRIDFEKIKGYDETFSGYGGEDHDIYFKLRRIGSRKIDVPKKYIVSLDHSDKMRTEHYSEKNKLKQSIINRSYAALKEKLLEANPYVPELPQKVREKLWLDVNSNMHTDFEALESDLTSVIFSGRKWLPDPYYLEIVSQVSIKIRRKHES